MDNNSNNQVTIVDIKMPFMSMVIFMIKAAIAAIPAFLILSLLIMGISVLLSTLFGGSGMMMSQ
jgi:cell division septal protein FtsQ